MSKNFTINTKLTVEDKASTAFKKLTVALESLFKQLKGDRGSFRFNG
jgi:hypothetical protein